MTPKNILFALLLSACIVLPTHAEENDSLSATTDWSTYISEKDREIKRFDLPALYRQIDDLIGRSPRFISQYEAKIDTMKQRLAKTTDQELKTLQTMELSKMYEPFIGDSTQAYTERALFEARKGGFKELEDIYMANLAYLCTFLGSQTEALTLLGRMNPAALAREARYTYYRAYMFAYSNLAANTQLASMREEFSRKYEESMDSLLKTAIPGSEEYYSHLEPMLRDRGEYIEALKVNDERLNMTQEGTHMNAIVCYSRYATYRQMGNMEMAKYWLCKSAIDDIRNAIMDQGALVALSELLQADGEIDRAARYISYTWECNRFFSPHMRSWQIAPLLSAIEGNYQAKIDRKDRLLTLGTIGSGALVLILLLLFLTVNYKRRKLSKSEKHLREDNERLQETNDKLQWLNDDLNKANKQLFAIKDSLEDALNTRKCLGDDIA